MILSRAVAISGALAALAALAALHVWAAHGAVDALWGANAYAFLPPAALPIALGVSAALIFAVLAWPAQIARVAERNAVRAPRAALAGAALTVTFTIAAASWRSAHLLLGDGVVVASDCVLGRPPAPLEPLASLLQHTAYRLATMLGGRPGFATAWSALAWTSIALGGAFAALLWSVLGVIEGKPPHGARRDGIPLARIAAWALLASQGYAQVFFGYVENYAWLACGIALYTLAAYGAIRDRRGLRSPGLALVLACLLHFAALLLMPSFAYLVAHEFRAGRAAAARRDLSIVALAIFVSVAALTASAPPGLALADALRAVLGEQLGRAGIARALGAHALQIANEILLTGPLAFPLFVVGWIATGAAPGGGANVTARFSIALGLGALAGLGLAGPSNLGPARNWDLMAPFGFAAALAGIALLREARPSFVASARALLVGVLISLVHTVPWLAVNADEARAIARFTHLSLPRADADATLGYWFGLTGRHALAERWLRASLAEDPREARAHASLGILEAQRGRDSAAVVELSIARGLLPAKADVAIRLIDALRRSGRSAEAHAIADSLAQSAPERAEFARLAADLDPRSLAGDANSWADRVRDALRVAPR